MAGRTIWKGYINFADVNVPVGLHAAVREVRIYFHLLHDQDNSRLHQQMFCINENEPVPKEHQVKGYEVSEGRYVVLQPEELHDLEPESGRLISVKSFVEPSEIPALFFDKTYYLSPDKSEKPYAELAEALKKAGFAGICRWTMRKRSYFGALDVHNGVLRLTSMRYADEVVLPDALDIPEASLNDRELSAAGDLINALSGKFEPEKYKNEYQEKLRDLIQKKARGEKIAVQPPVKHKATEPGRLLAALQESIKKAKA